MAKGQTSIYTNTEKNYKPTYTSPSTAKKITSPSLEQLQKDFDNAYEKQKAEDASILAAFENKQLKSKNLIKKAIRLQKIKEKAEQKKAEAVIAES